MRAFWGRCTLTVGAVGVLFACPTAARANGHHGGGTVPVPTAYVETVPTVYATTSYVVPTVYAVPSAYVATSWVQPGVYATSYAVTSYPAVVPTVYAPTSYVLPAAYYPTVYGAGTGCCVPDPCCASGGSAPGAAPANGGSTPGPGKATATAPAADAGVKPLPSTVDSTPAAAPDEPAPLTTRMRDSVPIPPAVGNTGTGAVDSNVPPTPPAPVPEKDATRDAGAGAVTPITPDPDAAKGLKKSPPVAPGGEGLELAPKGTGEMTREVQKPVYTPKTTAARAANVGASNVLEGKVVRQGTRQPVDGVRITLSDPNGVRSDLVTESDSRGYYAIHLPDGDWTVKVPSRSGKTYAVSNLTVGNGQIIDQAGREVPTLLIQR